MRKKILAVDDEADILRLLQYNLAGAGFEVIPAEDGPEALDIARQTLPDLIILDLMLPNMDGNEVLKRLKAGQETSRIPVVMLTAKGEEIDRVLGLELGADDYIVKPFSPRELVLRVAAVLRNGEPRERSSVIEAGPVSIDTERFAVSIEGCVLGLTSMEFRLLAALVKSRGRPLSREALLDRACGHGIHSGSRTIDTHVRRLRLKLGRYGRCIETVRGLGYRFTDDP